jgi:hypothetical protein
MKVALFFRVVAYLLAFSISSPPVLIQHSGCWDVYEHEILGRIAPVANNYVTIHFDRDTSDGTRNTVSTGMENGSEYSSKLYNA